MIESQIYITDRIQFTIVKLQVDLVRKVQKIDKESTFRGTIKIHRLVVICYLVEMVLMLYCFMAEQ